MMSGRKAILMAFFLIIFSTSHAIAGTRFKAKLLGYNVDGWPLEPSPRAACEKITTLVAPGGSIELLSVGQRECASIPVPEGTCVPEYKCDLKFTYEGGAPTYYSASVPELFTCPKYTFIGGPIYFNVGPPSPPFSPYDMCEDPCGPLSEMNEDGTACKDTYRDPPCRSTQNPIKIRSGDKWLREEDLRIIRFSRFLNPVSKYRIYRLGQGWTHSYDKSIASNGETAIIFRENGLRYYFSKVGTVWQSEATIADTLQEIKDSSGNLAGWRYTLASSGDIETYDTSGNLVSIQDQASNLTTLAYSSADTSPTIAPLPGLLIEVRHPLGASLRFSYDSESRMQSMIDPSGAAYTYAYDSQGNLASVQYPDGRSKTYLYENTSFPHALTGIIDETGQRYADYFYDSEGRAYAEQLAGGVDNAALSYSPGANGNSTTVLTDARGNSRTYQFTTILGVSKLTAQSQPAGSGCEASSANLTYDANGNVASRTDFAGHMTRYNYDLSRNLEISRTEGLNADGSPTPATRTTTTVWHPQWHLPTLVQEYAGESASGSPLKITSHSYDSHGNSILTTETDPNLGTSRATSTSITYSAAVPGLILQKVVNGPRTDVSDITTYDYYPHDASCAASSAAPIPDPVTGIAPPNYGCRGQLRQIINALGHITRYDRYNHHGQVEQITDANGTVSTSRYDLRQRLIQHTVDGQSSHYSYDPAGQLLRHTRPDGSYSEYSYDAAHRLIAISDNLGNRVEYTLDASGNRTATRQINADGSTARQQDWHYDALDRIERSVLGGSSQQEYTYDANGNLTGITDGRGKLTRFNNDTLDRRTTSTDPLTGITQTRYNTLDHTTEIQTPNGASTQYSYDALGQLLQETSPDRGTQHYSYDLAGNRRTSQDARGITVNFQWDALNRLIALSYPNPAENRSYTWDQLPDSSCAHGIGRLCQVTDAGGSTRFSYDARGNLIRQTRLEAGASLVTLYQYDSADRLLSTSLPTGATLNLQRQADGNIRQIDSQKGTTNTTLVRDIQTNALGQTLRQTVGSGFTETYSFNLLGYLAHLNQLPSSGGGGTPPVESDADIPTLPEWGAILMAALLLLINRHRWHGQRNRLGHHQTFLLALLTGLCLLPQSMPTAWADTTLEYDENQNIIRRTTPQGITDYGYDDLNRLNMEAGPKANQSIGYDANGNRISDGNASYSHSPQSNRLLSINGQPVTLDAAGYTLSARGLGFVWNQAGQLQEVRQGSVTGTLLATYTYDYRNRRSRKVTTAAAPQGFGTTLYVYDQADHLLAEIEPPGTPLVSYVWKDDTPIAVILHPRGQQRANPAMALPADDVTVYLETDHLGTPRAAKDSAGRTVWRWESEAFGNSPAQTDPDGDGIKVEIPLRFPGQYYDAESGLHYNHHRIYDAAMGRYISSDPIGLEGGNNTFAYVEGNPLNDTDPLGLNAGKPIRKAISCIAKATFFLEKYGKDCQDKCDQDTIKFISSYTASGSLDTALIMCACRQAGPTACSDYAEKCLRPGAF